ncbi:uncharacterized protein MONBRDRAFT_36062 [Monosiga brevicollis MX1]|uniref:Peptidase M20 dimerisation domain-containing protein n=1 Tax=Monosiga brevicollis TaxID=81824 RepID=A9URM4_MONBE|nr:uncharacterized protein MONBRDRAFT_36062 [Monosiga brevicollis MX1]EDQ91949.1 predicted protein [Monosiga brevicollis MX1]|eukprot:XP_001743235.1 hypothetical protein [Monosiga brevicollis MX1]
MDHDAERVKELRRWLHAHPEVSGKEARTAAHLAEWLVQHAPPDRLVRGLGGEGLAAIYNEAAPAHQGVLIRAELDALPITETSHVPWSSQHAGVMHACGHDGHASCLAGLALRLHATRPQRRVTLLFQPSEETGLGAAAVVADARWAALAAPRNFAIHNYPGHPLAQVGCRPGTMACASTGLCITLRGATAHAASPESGRSPAAAVAKLMENLPRAAAIGEPLTMTTLTHVRVGEPTYGIAPGHAVLQVTCRSEQDSLLEAEVTRVRNLVAEHAAGFDNTIELVEPFAATVNDELAVQMVVNAASAASLACVNPAEPARWSEDFGVLLNDARSRYGSEACGALLLLGSGEAQPSLHDSAYNFPDSLLQPGITVFEHLCRA